MRTALLAVALVLATVLSPMSASAVSASAIAPMVSPPHPATSGPVDSIQFIPQPNPSVAIQQMDAGTMDVYLAPLQSQTIVQTVQADSNLGLLRGGGYEYDLFVNPVPVNQTQAPGIFNPFESAEARRALNFIVDRDSVNQQVFSGMGFTHSTIWNPETPEFARDPFFFHDLNRSYSFNFTRGQAMLFNALNASGASYSGGQWTWQGNPIVVQFIVRIEDFRSQLGDYVTTQLRDLGLLVNEQKVSAGSAFSTIYYGPADTGAWMLYTEAFSYQDLVAWPDDDIPYYACGGDGSPVWSLYSPPPALAQVCTELSARQYTSLAQREALVEEGSALAVNESVRVWLVANTVLAYANRVQGLVPGFGIPLYDPFSLRMAHFATPGGTLVAGQRNLLIGPYQPWQGFSFIYDLVVANTFQDPGLVVHPYTGEYVPLRSDFQVSTAGPTGSLSVPSDAQVYNTTTEAWEAVPSGATAISKVTFDYTFGNWHHGVPMNMNDVLYAVSLIARRDHGDIAAHDTDALNYHDRAFAMNFRGLRVLNATRLEVYIDDWHVDPSFIAEASDVWPTTPWEVGELAMRTTLHDHTRVSEMTASIDGLPVIDLTLGETIGFMDREITDGNVTTSGTGVTLPPGFSSLINQTEATARWAGLGTWRNATGNYYPSNGPFKLTLVDPISSQITVSRFTNYPFPADRWDSLFAPEVPSLNIDPIPDVKPGANATVNMTTLVAGLPYSDATVRYRVLPANLSGVLAAGNATLVSPGSWQVVLNSTFSSAVPQGGYEIQAVAVGVNASLPVFANRSFFISTDTTPPTSTIAAVTPYWHDTAPITLQVTATDDATGVALVALYASYSADNVSWSPPAEVFNTTSPSFDYTFTPSSGPGHYRFWSLATDGAGNFETLGSKPATGEAQAGYDNVAPVSTLTGPSAYWHPTVPVSLTATASDTLAGVSSVQLWASYSADNTSWSSPALVTTDTTPPFAFSFGPASGDGHYRLWSVATDAAGNVESLSAKPATGQIAMGIDTVAPASTLSGPAGYWLRAAPIPLTATVTDATSGVVSVQLLVSFSADNVTWSAATVVSTDTTSPYAFSFNPAQGDGYYRFWVLATDAAGNAELLSGKPVSGQVSIGLDRVAPAVLSSTPANAATSVASTGTVIRITFSEAVDHSKAQAAFSISPSVQGTFSWSGNTLIFTPSAALANGTVYTVTLNPQVTDVAGNPMAAAYTFSFTTIAAPSGPPPQTLDWILPVGIAAVVIVLAAVLVWWWVARRKR